MDSEGCCTPLEAVTTNMRLGHYAIMVVVDMLKSMEHNMGKIPTTSEVTTHFSFYGKLHGAPNEIAYDRYICRKTL